MVCRFWISSRVDGAKGIMSFRYIGFKPFLGNFLNFQKENSYYSDTL